ncbi:MAG: hypothetical protein ACI9OJ_000183, partial [Myxococcota bacterium]
RERVVVYIRGCIHYKLADVEEPAQPSNELIGAPTKLRPRHLSQTEIDVDAVACEVHPGRKRPDRLDGFGTVGNELGGCLEMEASDQFGRTTRWG